MSLSKKLFTLGIIAAILTLVFYNPHDAEYSKEVDREIRLAAAICESSRDWVLGNRNRLKLDEATLKHIRVKGEYVTLEHVKYPKVLFFHDGFEHPTAQVDLVCHFKDPRGGFGRTSDGYFFDYQGNVWVNRTRMRR